MLFKLKLCLIVLIVGVLAIPGGSCAQTGSTITTSDLEDTKWVLESYGELGDLKDVLTDTRITAEFVSSEGTVKGSAGCN